MNEFVFGKCILCNIDKIKTMPFMGYESAAFFECPNCGNYIFSSLVFPFGLFDIDIKIKSLLSYYIRHHQGSESLYLLARRNMKK